MPHALAIDRMTSRYLVPRDQPQDGPLAARLDEIAATAMPRALSAILGAIASPADDSVWVIPRLEIELDVDTAWDADRLARCWAIALARTLARRLAGPGDGEIVRFEDRAEYVAALVADLADGRAWSRDWYRAFDGLRMLPASAAIRTVLIDEGEPGLAALTRLSASTLRRVLAAMAAHDAAIVAHQLIPATPGAIGHAAMSHAFAVWQADRDRVDVAGTERRAVWWLARVASLASPELPGGDVTAAAAAIAALEAWAAVTPMGQPRLAIGAVGLGDRHDDAEIMSAMPRPYRRVWLSHPDVFHAALTALDDSAPVGSTSHDTDTSTTTEFGAVFWLLPLLDRLPADTWTDRDQVFRFEVLIRCCAPEVRPSARRDAYLRDLFAMPPDAEPDDDGDVRLEAVGDWMTLDDHPAFDAAADDAYFGPMGSVGLAAHAVMRLFAWKLAGFGAASPRHLWSNCLAVPARVDGHRDRIVARIARPPLDVVLRLAGLFGMSYTLPRFDPRRIEIRAAD